ncbi:MAG: phage portal protein family protein [Kiritimatiellia bacterium]|jgi:phage gp29-like protein
MDMELKMTPEEAITNFNDRHEIPSDLRMLTGEGLLEKIEAAQGGSTYELFATYRDLIASDNHVQSEFGKRKGAVLKDTMTVQAWDDKSPLDKQAKELCTGLLDSEPFETACEWLLNATLYPVSVVEKVFKRTPTGFGIKEIRPVPYRLLDYRDGVLKIYDTDRDGSVLPTTHDADPSRYIIHRGHTMPLPDTWGGPMRSILFWSLLRSNDRQWWADLLERFGTPFMKGKYRDAQGKTVLERAFRLAVRLGGIVIHKDTEVEIVQAASGDSSNSHERFLDVCNKEISKLIVGQTLSSTADPTGIGGGASAFQSEVRDDIRQADARMLSKTIRNQLFQQLCAANGLAAHAPTITFGSESSREIKQLVSGVKDLYDAGLEPDDEGLATLQERVGFGLRRRAHPSSMPFSPFNLAALSADVSPVDRLSTASKAIDQALKRIILESRSSAECLRNLQAYLDENPTSDASEILAEAMDAYAARALR